MTLLQRSALQRPLRTVLQKRSHLPQRYASTSAKPSATSPLLNGLYATAFVVSTGLFAVYYFDCRSALHRYILTPVMRNAFDAETGHKVAVKVLKSGLAPRDPIADDQRLRASIWGNTLSSPVGLAAGFDKDAEAIDGLYNLGFSWVEVGSITPQPQPGNPRPRVFHLPEDSGLINRYGFPSQGHVAALARIKARIPAFQQPPDTAALRQQSLLAVNLGKNKTSPPDSFDDFVSGVQAFGPYADVLVINVSSPNTPGLRGLQNKDVLENLLSGVKQARDELPPPDLTSKRPRLVLKIAPDLTESQLIEMAEVIRNSAVDGVIVSNTTVQRPKFLLNAHKEEIGGLSGAPVKEYSLKALRTLRTHLPSSIPLIGCGGIFTGSDALEFARNGASMVQVYTSFGYDGVGACRRIKDELVNELEKEGKTWQEVVNQATDTLSWKDVPAQKPQSGDLTIGHLISEAQELQNLLGRLEERISAGEQESTFQNPVPVEATVSQLLDQ